MRGTRLRDLHNNEELRFFRDFMRQSHTFLSRNCLKRALLFAQDRVRSNTAINAVKRQQEKASLSQA